MEIWKNSKKRLIMMKMLLSIVIGPQKYFTIVFNRVSFSSWVNFSLGNCFCFVFYGLANRKFLAKALLFVFIFSKEEKLRSLEVIWHPRSDIPIDSPRCRRLKSWKVLFHFFYPFNLSSTWICKLLIDKLVIYRHSNIKLRQ